MKAASVRFTVVGWWASTAIVNIVLPASLPTQSPSRTIVAQVDHVMIRTNERERIVALLADTLKLPVVWPLPGSTWTFSTGLALGDLNLEITPSQRAIDTQLGDIAFQAVDFDSASDRSKQRGLDPRDPGRYTDSAGVKRWSTLGFRHPFAGTAFFVVKYHQFDMNERRTRFNNALRERKGGPLGLRRIVEFRLAYAPDSLAAARESWERLIGAEKVPSDRFAPPAGPAIRLVSLSGPRASSMLVEVESLAGAKRAAKSLELVLSSHRDSVVLDPARFGGLRFTLVGPSKSP